MRSNFYLDGALDADVQLPWMATLTRAARQAGRRVILLTHHAGVDVEPAGATVKATVADIWNQVLHATDGGPDYWYWGHVHAGYALAPFPICGRTQHDGAMRRALRRAVAAVQRGERTWR